MRLKQIMFGVMWGATLAACGAGSLVGCKRQGRVPTVSNVPDAPPPSTADDEKEREAKRREKLQELPDLGPGVAFTTPDGEIWNRYGCRDTDP